MALPSDEFRKTQAFFHAFGKVQTEGDQRHFESKYKSAHTVHSSGVWAEQIDYAVDETAADAFVAANPTLVEKKDKVTLTEIPGSNGQGYYIDDGGAITQPWIAPTDVISGQSSSLGYRIQLFQSDNTPIPYADGVWVTNYYAGIVLFQVGFTPADMGYGTPKATCYVYTGKMVGDILTSNSLSLENGSIVTSLGDVVDNAETKALDLVDISLFRTAEWLVSVSDGTNGTYYSSKILGQHDDSNAIWNEFASLGSAAISLSVDVSGGYMRLVGTATADGQEIRTIRKVVGV